MAPAAAATATGAARRAPGPVPASATGSRRSTTTSSDGPGPTALRSSLSPGARNDWQKVRDAIVNAGGSCTALAADVTSPETARNIVDTAMQAFGRIDVIANNAGAGAFGPLLEQTEAAIEHQWQLHVAGPLRLAPATIPQLVKNHGQLLFLGSGLARVPLPSYGAYASAKAAARAAAIQLRRELRGFGVAVTYVDPGLVNTEFHIAMGSKVSVQRAGRVSATGRESDLARYSPPKSGRQRRPVADAGRHRAGLARRVDRRGTSQDAGHAQRRRCTAGATGTRPPTRTTAAAPAAAEAPQPQTDPFETALESLARRMERVKLSPTFVRGALETSGDLELNELAMRWAGMPNGNERAALHEVLDALTSAGYLQSTGDETWKVLRTAG